MTDESGDDDGICNDDEEYEEEEDDGMSQGSGRSSSSKRPRRDDSPGNNDNDNERQRLWASSSASAVAVYADLDNNNNNNTPGSSSSGVVVVLSDEKKKKVGHDVGMRSSSPPRPRTRPPMMSNMITSSIAENAAAAAAASLSPSTFEVKDWEELKETLTQASELYDREDMLGSITLLRAVIHECRRFLTRFPDPTVFFTTIDGSNPDSDNQSTHRRHESPNAFHSLMGIALFLFGNIIAQNSSLAISREPNTPSSYWFSALDLFDAGDNLPCYTSGHPSCIPVPGPDDWRVSIAWGRTLVSLAYQATKSSLSTPPPSPSPAPSPSSPRSSHTATQRFAPRSPLAAIATLRMPGCNAHSRASASELLTHAADQFARGIFHMPHHAVHCRIDDDDDDETSCRRPRELFTIASEVLAVAERLNDFEARRRWATWADAVFHQMHMEADVDTWRARIGLARGRSWLVMGSARAEEMEDVLERGGDVRVLQGKEADDARAALVMACRSLTFSGKLTPDEEGREALYTRAQIEGGETVRLDLLAGSSRSSSRPITPRQRHHPHPLTVDVRMDES
ncbi:hypothetical protein BGW80DRAFT_1324583 [Lactifluus volemus]|nr:hypothetical protein BGW80DRAFT_1324583 [Lactifluus volemus]